MVGGCYAIQAGRVEVTGVFTNTTPVDAYRGAGRPEALFLLERMVDILARKLKKDPADIRRKNFIPADKFRMRPRWASRTIAGIIRGRSRKPSTRSATRSFGRSRQRAAGRAS